MKRRHGPQEAGYTIVELMIAIIVLGIVVYSSFELFTALVNSSLLMKRKAVALSLATSQMEYLKSLPYDSLAVQGGSIVATSYLPATSIQTVDGVKFTVTTDVSYVDEAYDGCGSYPTLALKQTYCRNYPPPAGAPATDTNPADYKIVHVKVTDTTGLVLSSVDSEIAARVAETASNTGALFVKIIDNNGNPVTGATAHVTNSTTSPVVDVSDSTDQNGEAIFYGLPPDASYDYYITGSLASYSSLTTIPPSGSLQPNYPNQKMIAQQSTSVTLQLQPMTTNSLVVETVNTSGSPLASVKVYAKGGYKKYTSTSDTSYYYDNMTPSDNRLVTDSNGLGALTNLVPGGYYFCGDTGATSCAIGSTTYYLAAAVPYGGVSPFSPIAVPTYLSSSPPAVTYSYNSAAYLQQVRLILTTSSTSPRITTLTPYDASQATSTMSNIAFNVTGANLPCSSTPASCNTTVKLLQGSSTYPASCTGAATGTQLSCTVNLSTAPQGWTQLQVTANGQTVTIPASPAVLGGINVTP